MSTIELDGEGEFIQHWLELEERLKAPSGKFKLIVCDKFDDSDATVGIFDTLEEALKARAGEKGEPNSLIEYLIYDDQGYLIEDSSLS